MKFYDIKNILNILFTNGKYELEYTVDKMPTSIKTPYYGFQNATVEFYMIKEWSYQKKVINFLCSIKWLNVNTDTINEIIEKNATNKDDECMLSNEEFNKLNQWFSSVKNKYDTMKLIIDEISYAGYDKNDLSFELHENITLSDLQNLLLNITKFGRYLAILFNQEEDSILKFKHFDIGSNDLIIGILAGSLSGVIAQAIIFCIKCIFNKFKDLFIKKQKAKQPKLDDKDNELLNVLLDNAKETGFDKKIEGVLKERLDNKYINEIYEKVKSTRNDISLKVAKDATDNDKQLIRNMYKIYEEINSVSRVSLITYYPEFKDINRNNILKSNEVLIIETKYLDKQYDEAIKKLKKEKEESKQINNKDKK